MQNTLIFLLKYGIMSTIGTFTNDKSRRGGYLKRVLVFLIALFNCFVISCCFHSNDLEAVDYIIHEVSIRNSYRGAFDETPAVRCGLPEINRMPAKLITRRLLDVIEQIQEIAEATDGLTIRVSGSSMYCSNGLAKLPRLMLKRVIPHDYVVCRDFVPFMWEELGEFYDRYGLYLVVEDAANHVVYLTRVLTEDGARWMTVSWNDFHVYLSEPYEDLSCFIDRSYTYASHWYVYCAPKVLPK